MESCPCCVNNEHKQQLLAAPLHELSEEQLSTYSWKAMTTWGNVDDFKHFLPRIFELIAISDLADDVTVLNKLNYAGWDIWVTEERDAVSSFLIALWHNHTTTKKHFNKELFVETVKRINNINLLLNNWVVSIDNISIRNFVNFTYYHLNDLALPANSFKLITSENRKQAINWATRQLPVLESAFFYFEHSDPEFAQEISNAVYVLEQYMPHSNKH